MRAAYNALRDHARARGIDFALPFDVFEAFAVKSNYLNKTGLNGDCLTVDRIDNLKGYVEGNNQPMTRAKNAEKRFKRDAIRAKAGNRWRE